MSRGTISQAEWSLYLKRLSRISEKAVEEFRDVVADNLGWGNMPRQKLIDAAYSISKKYGEASSALSATAYDSVAAAQGAIVNAAVPAEAASYAQVAKTVNGILKNTQSEEVLIQSVGLLTKAAGQKTTIQNAMRDGAEIAYIPQGDTCAYCLALASEGWSKASVKALDLDGEPAHLHANCDCTYGVRFNDSLKYAGYDPQKYYDMYHDPPNLREGERPTAKNRINAMRREFYAENKDKINEQKRDAYALRKAREDADEYNVNT